MNSAPSSTTYQQAVESQLQNYARFGVDLGLERIELLLTALGNPHNQVPIIHVAGTNGKGSVCAYLAAALTAAGYRTGRYTSPHLVTWTERICIDGEAISWEALQTTLNEVEAAIAPDQPVPTQFEVFTAAAWQYFARQQVDIAVVEVGLGGRLDATNVCGTPLATVIVSIGRDHWQRLGNTLADIAGEKAGILKPGVRAIAGPLPESAAAVVTQKATELNAPLTWVLPAVEEVVMGNPNTTPTLIYEGLRYPQALLGDHQRVNSACAIATLQVLQDQGWKISDEAIVQGLSQVRWPGRLQKGQWQGHELLIDGAHNTDAARSLRAFIDRTYPDEPITWLMGLLETKDHQGVLRTVLRQGDHLHLIPLPGHVSADPEALAAIAQTIDPSPAVVQTHVDLEDGLTAAVDALPGKTPIVFCGSLYLIGTFYERYGLLS
ncbi:MAG: folylpolyglutamate synthase/dihydrofolate synthase family protein [Cyanobacteria bacterium J06560_5]